MKKNLRRNWDPSYGFLSPQPRNRNTARGQDWGRAGEGTASPAPSSYSDRCSPSLSARSAALPDWNRNLVTGRESHIPLLLTSNIVHRQQQRRQQQLCNGGVGAAETSHSWHRGGVPATTTDNDCNRNGDSNLNCRVSSADPNRNIYRAGGGGGEGDNSLRFSTTASNRLVSDVEENYYQTIRTPQSDKKGAQQPRPLIPHHHRHQQVQLSDVYQSVISSPDKSTVSSSGRLSSDYQAVSSSSPLAAARGQQQQQRLFASPRRKDGPTPLAHSNIPVLLNRPWTAASAALAASASGSSSVAASPRRAATAGEQRSMGGVQPQQLEPAAVQRTRLGEGRIYGTGGSDKTTYNRGPPGVGCSYNPVNRNMYNLNTGRASLLASPSRYTDSFWGQCS
jgi:hypothetical protein